MVKVLTSLYPRGCQPKMLSDGFYLHEGLKKNLDSAKKAILKDWDMCFVIDGSEGSGKSVFALQIAKYLDPSFNVERCSFRAEDFKKCILNAKKYQCVVFDEAFGGLSSRRAMSNTNFMLVDLFAEMRQRNLFVIIVLPSIFELDRYAAIHRTRALIHVFHNNFERGYFRFYSYKNKKMMYLHGKKNYNYNVVKPSFVGRFTNFYTIDKEEYKKKKGASLRAMLTTTKEVTLKPKRQLQMEGAVAHFIKDLSCKDMARVSQEIGEPKNFLEMFRKRRNAEQRALKEAEKEIALRSVGRGSFIKEM